MKRILLYILASNLMMNLSFAQTGKTGLSFLKLGVDARALSMGESYSASIKTPAGTYYNPASISNSLNFQLLIMHKEWIQDAKTEFLAASTSLNNFSFGLSINSTSIKNIEIRTNPGPPIGTFDAQNASFGLTTAYDIKSKIYLGITGKIIYEKIYVDDATGYAFDFGGIYRTPWSTNIGLSLNNLGKMNQLQYEETKLPTSIRFGGMHQNDIIGDQLTVTISSDIVSFISENQTHLHVGTEFSYKNSIALRFGYQTGYESKNISAGVGFMYKMLNIDYAYVPFRYNLGSAHTFSLRISFE